jgi:hypothetical protein
MLARNKTKHKVNRQSALQSRNWKHIKTPDIRQIHANLSAFFLNCFSFFMPLSPQEVPAQIEVAEQAESRTRNAAKQMSTSAISCLGPVLQR